VPSLAADSGCHGACRPRREVACCPNWPCAVRGTGREMSMQHHEMRMQHRARASTVPSRLHDDAYLREPIVPSVGRRGAACTLPLCILNPAIHNLWTCRVRCISMVCRARTHLRTRSSLEWVAAHIRHSPQAEHPPRAPDRRIPGPPATPPAVSTRSASGSSVRLIIAACCMLAPRAICRFDCRCLHPYSTWIPGGYDPIPTPPAAAPPAQSVVCHLRTKGAGAAPAGCR